jgi:hypothetical protein
MRAAFVIATIIILYACVVFYFVSLGVEPAGTKRLVTLYDKGQARVVLTRATTVQAALDAANITLNSRDTVDPSREAKLTTENADIIIYRSRLVAVNDGPIRQSVLTVAQSPNAILEDARLASLGPKDKAMFGKGDLTTDGTSVLLKIERVEEEPVKPQPIVFAPLPNALTRSKGAQIFVDSSGVAHRETYYDLPMNVVMRACGGGSYTVRSDGAKVDQDGYVLVAANLRSYPRCTVVETSLGPGKVYDTGGFAVRHPYGFDLATDWTNYNGQ